MINHYARKDSQQFAEKVRRRIVGWYRNDEDYSDAVRRIVLQREEIIGLFEKVKKVDVKRLLLYLDTSGFFYRPSSANRHRSALPTICKNCIGAIDMEYC